MTESIGGCLWPGEKRICVQMGGTVKKKIQNLEIGKWMITCLFNAVLELIVGLLNKDYLTPSNMYVRL